MPTDRMSGSPRAGSSRRSPRRDAIQQFVKRAEVLMPFHLPRRVASASAPGRRPVTPARPVRTASTKSSSSSQRPPAASTRPPWMTGRAPSIETLHLDFLRGEIDRHVASCWKKRARRTRSRLMRLAVMFAMHPTQSGAAFAMSALGVSTRGPPRSIDTPDPTSADQTSRGSSRRRSRRCRGCARNVPSRFR